MQNTKQVPVARESADTADREPSEASPHRRASQLSHIILGGQDGLVNVLGVILGVAAATSDARIVLAAGFAATFAESVSMAAVAYTSTQANQAMYESERAHELVQIGRVPELEREQIRQIYEQKGFRGDQLQDIVESITRNKQVWADVLMAEHLHMAPVEKFGAVYAALIVGVAAIIGSLIPLAPFLVMPVAPAIWVSLGISVVALFAVGAYKAHVTIGRPARSGLEMAVIGIASALVGYAVGLLFRAPVTP